MITKNYMQYNKKQFETILPLKTRSKVIFAQKKVFNKFKSKLNYNFFKSPHLYNETYQKYLDIPYRYLNFRRDLSLAAMDVIYYLGRKKIKNLRLLDYGCGLSGIIKYGQKYGNVKGFDNYTQIPEEEIKYFYNILKIDTKTKLVNLQEIIKWKPNVISVCGAWVSHLELYKLNSIKILLSDRLYNSGAVRNQGVFYYKSSWSDYPEKFGFSLKKKLPVIDVYVR